jgi:hypothetical protein
MEEGHVLQGCVLTPDGWLRGGVEFSRRIDRVFGQRCAGPAAGEDIVLPGFIDLHVHGGGGADTMDGGDAIERIARLHARHGTTALLATTVTADREALRRALAGIGPAVRRRPPGAAAARCRARAGRAPGRALHQRQPPRRAARCRAPGGPGRTEGLARAGTDPRRDAGA